MVWESHVRCESDLKLKYCRETDSTMGACNIFDEMPTNGFEDWREPSCVLEVRVLQACYPITQKVLHQVFDPFGAVEISVCELWDGVQARILFPSKVQAAEAFGEFHGRNIYDGCCQLDINWGISQECEGILGMNNYSATTSSVSTWLCASATSICIAKDFIPSTSDAVNFDKEPVWDKEPVIDGVHVVSGGAKIDMPSTYSTKFMNPVVDTVVSVPVCTITEVIPDFGLAMVYAITEEHIAEAAQAVLSCIDTNVTVQPIAAPDATGLGVDTGPDHTVDAFLLIEGLFEDVPTPMEASEVSPLKLSFGNELDIPLPGKCLTACLDHVIDVQASASTVSAAALNFLNHGIVLYDWAIPWVMPVKCVDWQLWPPLMLFEILHDSVEIRPLPWPSFILTIDCSISWDASFVWKPPWPYLACLQIRWLRKLACEQLLLIDNGQPDWQGVFSSGGVVVVLLGLIWLSGHMMVLLKELVELPRRPLICYGQFGWLIDEGFSFNSMSVSQATIAILRQDECNHSLHDHTSKFSTLSLLTENSSRACWVGGCPKWNHILSVVAGKNVWWCCVNHISCSHISLIAKLLGSLGQETRDCSLYPDVSFIITLDSRGMNSLACCSSPEVVIVRSFYGHSFNFNASNSRYWWRSDTCLFCWSGGQDIGQCLILLVQHLNCQVRASAQLQCSVSYFWAELLACVVLACSGSWEEYMHLRYLVKHLDNTSKSIVHDKWPSVLYVPKLLRTWDPGDITHPSLRIQILRNLMELYLSVRTIELNPWPPPDRRRCVLITKDSSKSEKEVFIMQVLLHRLGVKPNFKKGGMSGYEPSTLTFWAGYWAKHGPGMCLQYKAGGAHGRGIDQSTDIQK